MAVTDEEALPAGTSSNYDRMKELKAFDESKAGVKGLVDSGVEKIPRFFIRPPDEEHLEGSDSDPTHLQIPTIDLTGVENSRIRRGEIVEAIKQASATWGFFQLVNHGVPTSVLEEMIEGAKRFNEEDDEVKREYYTRDDGKKVLFSSNFDLYESPAANWRDTLFCVMAPGPLSPHELPLACRDIMMEYSKHMIRLGNTLFELLSEALGLQPNHLKNMDCAKGHTILCHYYPACPEPDLTLGTTKHSDPDFLTVLLQDHIGGLQVLHQNKWVDVQPMHGALVINIGDILQLVMDLERNGESQDNISNVGQPRIQKKRKERGTTLMLELTKNWDGNVITVEYDQKGRPTPQAVRRKIAGYEGALARVMVPLNAFSDWRKLKDLRGGQLERDLWATMKTRFVLDENTRAQVISDIGLKWRTFRTTLTTKYILPFKDNPGLLVEPPTKYKFIDKLVWTEFVQSRLTPEFQELNILQSKRQSNNVYTHRLSRSGYAGLEEDIKKKSIETGIFVDHEDRSVKWKLARQNKNGEYSNDSTREVVGKIDDLKKKVNEGAVMIEGSRDVLTMALGTPEHCGRVRGEGKHVTPMAYFKIPKRGTKKYNEELLAQLHESQERVRILEQIVKDKETHQNSPHSENIASNSSGILRGQQVEDGGTSKVNKTSSNILSSPQNCRLALGSKDKIVAKGKVYGKTGPLERIHNISLGEHNVRVSIDCVLCPDSPLPIPVRGILTTILDAHNSFVAWPEKWVILADKSVVDDSSAADGDATNGDATNGEGASQLQKFAKIIEKMMKSREISIPLEKGVFEEDIEFNYFLKSDLLDLCNMKKLEVNSMTAYQRFLYDRFEDSRVRYGFSHPAHFNDFGDKEEMKRNLIKRMKIAKKDQLIFVPYSTMGHWLLLVIDMTSMEVFWLDSLVRKVVDLNVKFIVNDAMKVAAMEMGKRIKGNPTWELVKCPKQTGKKECGVYVMKFMKHLMEDPLESTKSKLKELGEVATYGDKELNDLRLELVEYILDFINNGE